MTQSDSPALTPARRTGSIRLCIMMFLEFFVWGAWYVTTSAYMTQAGMTSKIGIAYTLCPIAALISPFFLGMIADRFFASEKVLAVLALLGGVAMFFVPMAVRHGTTPFLLVILLHALCYMPTLGLTNSIAFAHLTDQEKQFPLIRTFGTIGWIVAGVLLSLLAIDTSVKQYVLTGAASVLMGCFSFALPHTPPPARGKRVKVGDILGLDAMALFRSPSFCIFAIASFLICIPLAAYYAYAGRLIGDIGKPIGATMALGQASEVIFMLLMPLFFLRLGIKWMLALGMLSWAVRYILFAAGAPHAIFWMIAIGIALHGMCYDFFFVTGFIYTDKKASREIRNQAQGLLVLITQGLGLGIGAYLTGDTFNHIIGTHKGAAALALYPKFWWIWAIFAIAVLIFFAIFFRDDSSEAVSSPREFEAEPMQSSAE